MLAAMIMSSCLVNSLHPFYKESDIIFDEGLIGTWMDGDSAIWIIEANTSSEEFLGPEKKDNKYSIRYYQEEDAVSYLVGTLFELNGDRFVDFFPADEEHFDADMTGYHFVPVHTLAQFAFDQDSLMFFWFGEEWINELFEEKKIRVDHETVNHPGDYSSTLLTANTDDLQKFISKYMQSNEIRQVVEHSFDTGEEAEEHAFIKLYPYDGPIPGKE